MLQKLRFHMPITGTVLNVVREPRVGRSGRGILAVLSRLLILACIASTTTACDPLIVAATYANQETNFTLLSDPIMSCPRIYRDTNMLYLLSADGASSRVIRIYDPRTSVIYSAPFSRTKLTTGMYGGQAASGGSACFLGMKGWQTGTFRSPAYVASPTLRQQLATVFAGPAVTSDATPPGDVAIQVQRYIEKTNFEGSLVPIPAYAGDSDEKLELARARLQSYTPEQVTAQTAGMDAAVKAQLEAEASRKAARLAAAREESRRLAAEPEKQICAGGRYCYAAVGELIETTNPGRECDATKPINQFTPGNNGVRSNGPWFLCAFNGKK